MASSSPRMRVRGLVAGVLGLASIGLLAAAFRWAHHWGVAADSIVTAWVLATMGAFGFSIWSLQTTEAFRRLAKLGLWLTAVSLFALIAVGVASAADISTAGSCGGG